MSRPGRPGIDAPQACSTSARAAASASGRPPGSSVPSAPASSAPRSPARRGTQASAGAGGVDQVADRGEQARGLRGPLADQHHRAGGAQQRAQLVAFRGVPHPVVGDGSPASPVSTAASVPGSAPIRVPDILRRPLLMQRGHGKDRKTSSRGLAQPQEQDRRLLLRLQRDQQHRGRRLQAGVAHPAALRRGAGDPGGEECRLLGGVRAGPEVDVVGAQRQSGELRVGVGVGEVSRPPASTPTPPLSRAAASPAAAAVIASVQDVGCSTPSASRTSGRVIRSPSRTYGNANRPLSQFHSSLTSGSVRASRRVTAPARWSVRSAQPPAQCSQTVSVDTRSNGRARNR